jgi:hypothetical protein
LNKPAQCIGRFDSIYFDFKHILSTGDFSMAANQAQQQPVKVPQKPGHQQSGAKPAQQQPAKSGQPQTPARSS